MKLYLYLVLIACLVISCKNIDKSKNVQLEQEDSLYFSKEDFTKNKTTTKFSKSFVLNQNKFLSIQFNLKKPLVSSLQLLAPNLTTAQLLDKGNFQFSFLVDGKLIENLHVQDAHRIVALNQAIAALSEDP